MQYIYMNPVKPLAVQAKAKIMDFNLTFLPKNPLVPGALVEIKFPSDGSIKLFDISKNRCLISKNKRCD